MIVRMTVIVVVIVLRSRWDKLHHLADTVFIDQDVRWIARKNVPRHVPERSPSASGSPPAATIHGISPERQSSGAILTKGASTWTRSLLSTSSDT